METLKQPIANDSDAAAVVENRRRLVKGVGAAFAGVAVGALGFPAIVRSQGRKKFGRPIIAPVGTNEEEPQFYFVNAVKKKLAERFDWEVSFVTSAFGSLGSDQGQMVSVQTGFIDLMYNSTQNWSSATKVWEFMDLPYLLPDWDTALKVLKSDPFWAQAKKMEAEVKLKVLPPITSGGYRILWNRNRVLRTPADVQGMKFRTTPSALDVGVIRAWGGNPTPIDWFETYSAIQQNVVSGLYSQPYWAKRYNFQEVVKHGTETRANWVVNIVVMNVNLWNAMPKALQEAFWLASIEAADEANQRDRAIENDYVSKLRADGVAIYTPSAAEQKEWRSRGETVWQSPGAKSIDRSLIESIRSIRP
jgi:TRAP-type C4-dicarboxylate transport system substrate-binding protein